MKKAVLFVATMLISALFFPNKPKAQENNNPEQYKVLITLKSGQKVSGYIRSSLYQDFNGTTVKISETPNDKEIRDYKNSDIERLVFTNSQDSTNSVWVSLRATRFSGGSSKKEFKEPILLMRSYVGKNVIGYKLPAMAYTVAAPNAIGVMTSYSGAGMIYYCLVKGTDLARAYWMYDPTATFTIGAKTSVRMALNDYPELKDAFKEKNINLKKDPEAVVRALDEIIEQRNNK